MQDNKIYMSSDSKIEQFEKEWREGVTSNLNYLRTKMDELPQLFANRAEMKSLSDKVDSLEASKNKLIGGILLFNAIIAIATYLFTHHT